MKCNIFIHGNLFLLNFPSESIYFTGVTGNLHQVQSERLLTQKHHMYMTPTISVFLLCFADEEGCKDTCPVSCLSGQKSPSSPFSISASVSVIHVHVIINGSIYRLYKQQRSFPGCPLIFISCFFHVLTASSHAAVRGSEANVRFCRLVA